MSQDTSRALQVACPMCGAEPGKCCRVLTTRFRTLVHDARWDALVAAADKPEDRVAE